jgi:hypothetical protein
MSLWIMALREVIERCYVAFKTSKLARRETSLIDMVNTSKADTDRCYVRPEASVDKDVGRLRRSHSQASSWPGRGLGESDPPVRQYE